MGKPITQSRREVEAAIEKANTLISIAPEALADVIVENTNKGFLKYVREPLGVSYIIAPWNRPISDPMGVIIVSILAGNTVCLKHSAVTPLSGKFYEKAFQSAGVNIVRDVMSTPAVSEVLFKMPQLGFLYFSGSQKAGHIIQEQTAEVSFLQAIYEVGGKDAAYVAEDADLQLAVEKIMHGAFYNNGQISSATERIYVTQSLYDEFLDRAAKVVKTFKIGDPMNEDTFLGPLASREIVDRLSKQVK